MLKTIKIENFRGFQSFELQQLGRINLLVGQNNSGKTSALEAIQILCSRRNIEPLSQVMTHRGEVVWNQDDRQRNGEIDVRHLFYGHQIEPQSKFSISGINDNILEEVVVSIEEFKLSFEQLKPFLLGSIDDKLLEAANREQIVEILSRHMRDRQDLPELAFIIKASWETGTESLKIPLSPSGCLVIDSDLSLHTENENRGAKTEFITSSSLKITEMIEMFDRVVLTPEEENVYEALQTIEPVIKRIATVGHNKYKYSERSRGGFDVLRSDTNQRVPIGSMGDGIWRMFGLALSTVCAKDGFLFVDEIDTGLHFTVLCDMWNLLWKTATRLNVQVFATTHSSDCWTSLATIASQEAAKDGITIHRIERGKETSVVFTAREIAIAAERGIEVR